MSEITLFYTLSYVDEDGKQHIFYVGRTSKKLSERLAEHQEDARKNRTPKGKLMNALAQQGIATEITEIARTSTHATKVVAPIEDALIAQYRAMGCDLMNVGTGRLGGVPGRHTKIEWTEEMLNDLGVLNNADVAKKYNIGISAVSRKRKQTGKAGYGHFDWTPEAIALLGSASDADVAKRLGLERATVSQKRRALNIPDFGYRGRPPSKVNSLPDEYHQRLGTTTDQALAAEYGVDPSTVRKSRLKRNIPPYNLKNN